MLVYQRVILCYDKMYIHQLKLRDFLGGYLRFTMFYHVFF